MAGEAISGVPGRNRLMGNSLLDIIVLGRRAGSEAALRAKQVELGKLTLRHVAEYKRALENAGIKTERVSPLLLPDYAGRIG